MKYVIDVTAEDIAEGRRWDCEKCPIVLAARRALPPSFQNLTASPTGLGYGRWERKQRFAIPLPAEAQGFMRLFDGDGRAGSVDPISFELDVDTAFRRAW
jgi:hypothetical protein